MSKESLVEKLRREGHLDASRSSVWAEAIDQLSIFDAIAREGANTLVKMDGARDKGSFYTVIVSGGRLGEDFFRKDGSNLMDLLRQAIEFYDEKVWSLTKTNC